MDTDTRTNERANLLLQLNPYEYKCEFACRPVRFGVCTHSIPKRVVVIDGVA